MHNLYSTPRHSVNLCTAVQRLKSILIYMYFVRTTVSNIFGTT